MKSDVESKGRRRLAAFFSIFFFLFAANLHAATVLSPDGRIRVAVSVSDDGDNAQWRNNPNDYVIESQAVTQSSMLDIVLAAGGGAAIRLSPVSN